MDTKVIKVQITFDKDELSQLRSMLHDSMTHWHRHLVKASENTEYHLTVEGCEAVLQNAREMYNEVSKLYDKNFA